MSEMVEWLRREIKSDLARAQAATPGPWRHNPNKHWRKPGTAWFEEAVFAGPAGKDAICIAGTGETDEPQSMADAAHIAVHDPRDVIADCEAKLALLDGLQRLPHYAWDARPEYGCSKFEDAETWAAVMGDIEQRCTCGRDDHVERMLRDLLSAYRHRDGYKQDWSA